MNNFWNRTFFYSMHFSNISLSSEPLFVHHLLLITLNTVRYSFYPWSKGHDFDAWPCPFVSSMKHLNYSTPLCTFPPPGRTIGKTLKKSPGHFGNIISFLTLEGRRGSLNMLKKPSIHMWYEFEPGDPMSLWR